MSWKYMLFDLDGTITDSREGIIKCVEYALNAAGVPIPPMGKMYQFMGPPLVDGFQNIMGMSYEEAVEATRKYRERYSVTGLYENKLFDGIDEVLKTLHEKGYQVILATSKPEEYSVKILEHFGIAQYFNEIVGSTLDGSRDCKRDVIQEAFRRTGISEEEKKSTIMIGDRKHDMIGARECGIASCGVYYGFASEPELEENGADYILHEVSELLPFLLG